MTDQLTINDATFKLKRYPLRNNDSLRAWDAADEYLLHHLFENKLPHREQRVLIVNDSFGALCVPLAQCSPDVFSDSFIAQQSIQQNTLYNECEEVKIKFINSTDKLNSFYDIVVIKLPKNQALLEDQLYRIKQHTTAETIIIAAGMVKAVHRSTLQLFEAVIGPTTTSLARKKARLIFSHRDMTLTNNTTPYPKSYHLNEYNLTVANHANVFSRQKLDIGTRFFLENMPSGCNNKDVIDLGCGNGLLGVIFASKNAGARLKFIDESYMAVASAKINYDHLIEGQTASSDIQTQGCAEFIVADCLAGIGEDSVDLILNNPPFHQSTAVGDHVAWQMFTESKKVLRNGGELWVIGNRHLGYHTKLKRLFGNCETVASNQKFVLLRARKGSARK